jgi:hypothetical protein
LLSPTGEAVALELVAATIGAKMLDFFDDQEVGLLSACRKSLIKPLISKVVI